MYTIRPTGSYQFFNRITIKDPQKTGIVDSSSRQGSQIEQRPYVAGTGQEWIITHVGNGDYTILNTNSGQALAIPDESPRPGMQLITSTYKPSASRQRWKIRRKRVEKGKGG